MALFNYMEEIRIGIALSGGGAKGIAHIGILKALLENDIVPHAVAGTSAGSIAGALYAAGCSPEEMLDFVKDASIFKIFKVVLPLDGLTNLNYLRERLTKFITEEKIEKLERELHIGVVNLNTGEHEIWSRGNVFDVVTASCSIPLVFKPVEIEGQLYVDGGLLNNLLVAPLMDTCDYIIGVNVIPHALAINKNIQNVFGIAIRCFELSIHANTMPNIDHCDLLIEPEGLNDFSIFQFNKHTELYEIGYKTGLEYVAQIKQQLGALNSEKQHTPPPLES
ncbi:MAG: patatin-like phospholipase family protein [Bacteroidota bacterium]